MCVLQGRTDQAFKAVEKEKGSRKRKETRRIGGKGQEEEKGREKQEEGGQEAEG